MIIKEGYSGLLGKLLGGFLIIGVISGERIPWVIIKRILERWNRFWISERLWAFKRFMIILT